MILRVTLACAHPPAPARAIVDKAASNEQPLLAPGEMKGRGEEWVIWGFPDEST